MDTLNPYKKL